MAVKFEVGMTFREKGFGQKEHKIARISDKSVWYSYKIYDGEPESYQVTKKFIDENGDEFIKSRECIDNKWQDIKYFAKDMAIDKNYKPEQVKSKVTPGWEQSLFIP